MESAAWLLSSLGKRKEVQLSFTSTNMLLIGMNYHCCCLFLKQLVFKNRCQAALARKLVTEAKALCSDTKSTCLRATSGLEKGHKKGRRPD